jgi:hypothetical protein
VISPTICFEKHPSPLLGLHNRAHEQHRFCLLHEDNLDIPELDISLLHYNTFSGILCCRSRAVLPMPRRLNGSPSKRLLE